MPVIPFWVRLLLQAALAVACTCGGYHLRDLQARTADAERAREVERARLEDLREKALAGLAQGRRFEKARTAAIERARVIEQEVDHVFESPRPDRDCADLGGDVLRLWNAANRGDDMSAAAGQSGGAVPGSAAGRQ